MAVSGSDWRSGLRLPLHHLHHRTEAFLEGDVKVKGEMIGVRALARFCVAGNLKAASSRRTPRRAAPATHKTAERTASRTPARRQRFPVRNMEGSHGFDMVHRPEPVERQCAPTRRWRAIWRWAGRPAG